jgi:hypothetical protein
MLSFDENRHQGQSNVWGTLDSDYHFRTPRFYTASGEVLLALLTVRIRIIFGEAATESGFDDTTLCHFSRHRLLLHSVRPPVLFLAMFRPRRLPAETTVTTLTVRIREVFFVHRDTKFSDSGCKQLHYISYIETITIHLVIHLSYRKINTCE